MTVLQCLFSFKGRMCRRDYWLKGVLVMTPLNLLLTYLLEHASASGAMLWVLTIAGIATVYPLSALFVKRLHDRDRSGWFAVVPILVILLQGAFEGIVEVSRGYVLPEWLESLGLVAGLVTIVLALWAVVILFPIAFFKGTAGPNRFGDDPLGVHSVGQDREISRDPAGHDGATT